MGELYFLEKNHNWTFCSLKGAVKGCNTYSETAFAPQSKTFPARSPFTSANCLSSQPRESSDSITLWKHFKAIPFSFCFTCKTDRKHWIYRPNFLAHPWLSQPQGHVQASPLCSWPLMDQPITIVSVLRTKKNLSWILIKSFSSARIWSTAQEWLFLASQSCNRSWADWKIDLEQAGEWESGHTKTL